MSETNETLSAIEDCHFRWRRGVENFLREVGADYCFDTEHSFKILGMDESKVRPISRPLSMNEQQMVYFIAESTGVRIPVLDPSSHEFLYNSIFST